MKLVTAVLFLKSATLAPVRLVHDEKRPANVVATVHVENAMRELKFPRADLKTKPQHLMCRVVRHCKKSK